VQTRSSPPLDTPCPMLLGRVTVSVGGLDKWRCIKHVAAQCLLLPHFAPPVLTRLSSRSHTCSTTAKKVYQASKPLEPCRLASMASSSCPGAARPTSVYHTGMPCDVAANVIVPTCVLATVGLHLCDIYR